MFVEMFSLIYGSKLRRSAMYCSVFKQNNVYSFEVSFLLPVNFKPAPESTVWSVMVGIRVTGLPNVVAQNYFLQQNQYSFFLVILQY